MVFPRRELGPVISGHGRWLPSALSIARDDMTSAASHESLPCAELAMTVDMIVSLLLVFLSATRWRSWWPEILVIS
jgi:hypothetical protein